MIQSFGDSHQLPDTAFQPDPALEYKIVFDISKGGGDAGKVNPGLNRVARAVNVFEGAGYPADQLRIAAVLHGKATGAALTDEAYREIHSRANPNTALLSELRGAGVEIYLCGQAMVDRGFERGQISPEVTLALSALTVTSTCQLLGYALIPD